MDGGRTERQARSPARGWGAIMVWALVLGVLALVGFALLRVNRGPLKVGDSAPDFVLTTFEGERIDTSEMRGQVILVNFWASWCDTCVQEAEALEQAYQLYQDQGVVFLGVDWSDTESRARAYLARHGITYPNGPDLGQRIYAAYRVRGVPETYVIGPHGRLRAIKVGPFSSLEEIVGAIESAREA